MRNVRPRFLDPAKLRFLLAPFKGLYTRLRVWPPMGWIGFGSLKSLTPISRVFGLDRGLPIDRYYIEKFLQSHLTDLHGCVLEVGDDFYAQKYKNRHIKKIEVLHAVPGNPKATIIADLAQAHHIPSDSFDCIILIQTLQFIYDYDLALHHIQRILKPAGVLLLTVPGISQISRYDMDRWGEYWRFTTLSLKRKLSEVFGSSNMGVQSFGNVKSAISFLHGLASEELSVQELDFYDPDYEVIIAARAMKSID